MKKPRNIEFKIKDAPWCDYGAQVYESFIDENGKKIERDVCVDASGLTAAQCRRLSAWLLKAAKWIEEKR